MEIKEKLGKRIRQLRKEKGMSQEDLAHKSQLHRTYISTVERGFQNVSIENLEKIALALGVDLADLFPKDAHPGTADR